MYVCCLFYLPFCTFALYINSLLVFLMPKSASHFSHISLIFSESTGQKYVKIPKVSISKLFHRLEMILFEYV